MKWSVVSESLAYDRAYSFTYDALNRLTAGNYCGISGGSVYSDASGKYNESVTYDNMGNILTLNRIQNGSGLNQLTYTYSGNHLTKVDNALSPVLSYGSEAFNDRVQISTEYLYDKNGNTIYDANGGISTISYNLLNLPTIVQFTAGHQNRYTYSSDGKKLANNSYTLNTVITVPQGTISTLPTDPSNYVKVTTNYVANVIYEGGVVTQVQTSEGYIKGTTYYYYLKDHLGNNRIVIDGNGTTVEKSHYYPFGMRFYSDSSTASSTISFHYNGKEYDSMNGFNHYDYGARFYDPALGRWSVPDPMAEKYPSSSPYVYVSDNPLKYIDPDGKEKIIAIKPTNEVNKAIIKAAEKYKDDGAIHIWAHGNPNSMTVYSGGKDVPIRTTDEFKKFLSINSKIWQDKGENDPITIILHSCKTGKETGKEPSFASKVSKDLKNTTVIAPTENVIVTSDGIEGGTYSTKEKTNDDGTITNEEDKEGQWIEYSVGKQVDTYPGNIQPQKPSDSLDWLRNLLKKF
jgi:RHS repeat-associated protein